MKCPRCGEEMTGGICNSCGFPMNKRAPKSAQMLVYKGIQMKGETKCKNRRI
jgi:ribosomal protein L37E